MFCGRIRRATGVGCGAERVVFYLELAVGVFEPDEPGLGFVEVRGMRVDLAGDDAVADNGLEAVEFLGALLEMVLECLVLPPEVLFDGFDLALEAANHALYCLDSGEEVLAEAREHGGHSLKARQGAPVNQAVVVGPVGTTNGRETSP